MSMEQWKKEAKETYKSLVETKPTKEGMLLMGSALTILAHEKMQDIMEDMGRMERYDDRYDDRYEMNYARRRNYR